MKLNRKQLTEYINLKIKSIITESFDNQISSTSYSDLSDRATDMFGIGDICFYKDQPIGIVVLTNPMTIISITSFYDKSGIPLKDNNNKYLHGYMSYKDAMSGAKKYKIFGTKKGNWHIPSVDELTKIGFVDRHDEDIYRTTEHATPNTKFLNWISKINNSLKKLEELNYFCVEEFNSDCVPRDFWVQDTFTNSYNNEKCGMYFTTSKIYTNRPNSYGSICGTLLTTDWSGKPSDVSRSACLFYTLEAKDFKKFSIKPISIL